MGDVEVALPPLLYYLNFQGWAKANRATRLGAKRASSKYNVLLQDMQAEALASHLDRQRFGEEAEPTVGHPYNQSTTHTNITPHSSGEGEEFEACLG